jgi:hypothetical protein
MGVPPRISSFTCTICGETFHGSFGAGRKYCNSCYVSRSNEKSLNRRKDLRRGGLSLEEQMDIAEDFIKRYFEEKGQKDIVTTYDIAWWVKEHDLLPDYWNPKLLLQYLARTLRVRFPEYRKIGERTYAIHRDSKEIQVYRSRSPVEVL